MSCILNNFRNNPILYGQNNDTSTLESCEYILELYRDQNTKASTATSGDKQIILNAIKGMELSEDEIKNIQKELDKPISSRDNNNKRICLILDVLTKLRDDHRSLFLHIGATESYKVAIKYLQSLVRSDGQEIRGKGHGALGVFGTKTYILQENFLTGKSALEELAKLPGIINVLTTFQDIHTPESVSKFNSAEANNSCQFVLIGDGDGSAARIFLSLLSSETLILPKSGLLKLAALIKAEHKLIKECSPIPNERKKQFIKFQSDKNLQDNFEALVECCKIVNPESLKDIIFMGDNLFDRLSLSFPCMLKLLHKITLVLGKVFLQGNHDSHHEIRANDYKFGCGAIKFNNGKPISKEFARTIYTSLTPGIIKRGVLFTHHGVYMDKEKTTIHTAFGTIQVPSYLTDYSGEKKHKWLLENINKLANKYNKTGLRHHLAFNKFYNTIQISISSIEVYNSRAMSNFNKHLNYAEMEIFNDFFELKQVHGHVGHKNAANENKGIVNVNSRKDKDSEQNMHPYSIELIV